MATRPKAVIESRNGEKLSPITIAKNVLTDDGQNLHDILSDRKEDMMTPTIENSSSMFKVGQGDNVDYSSNVVNGAYEGMVLKGKTMVNCIQEPSSKGVVLPYEFAEGQYVTINDTKESGALGVELKGQTLVNLYELTGTPYQYRSGSAPLRIMSQNLIQGKTYMIILNFSTVNADGKGVINFFPVSIFIDGTSRQESNFNVSSTGVVKIKYTPSKTVEDYALIIGGNNFEGYNPVVIIENAMIIEYVEGMENWDIPYFTGMASCKMPILHTKNNLFNGKMEIGGYDVNTGGVQEFDTRIRCVDFIPINSLSNTTMKIINSQRKDDLWILQYDSNKNHLGRSSSFNIPRGVCKQKLNLDSNCAFIKFYEVGVTRLDLGIEYIISDKSSILSLPEEVVLRSLPNGVRDTFNTRTGVYTQRINEVVLNGSGSIALNANYSKDNVLCFDMYNHKKGRIYHQDDNNGLICDKLIPRNWSSFYREKIDEEGIVLNRDSGTTILIKIAKTKLATPDVNGVKAYLKDNPITVQYQLETPIITKINLPSTLKPWNTTTHIYSEIPENSLYPILSHSNPTYPVILKPSTKYSIVANSYSNNHTNSTINFNLGGATASTTVGNRVTTITTPSTLSNELLTMSGRGNKLNNVMVIEGDVVGDEPYFEGICDCKSPILSNVGKNLFDNVFTVGGWWNGVPDYSPDFMRSVNLTPVKPNTTYTYDSTVKGHRQNANFMAHDADGNFIEYLGFGRTFTTPSNCHYIHLYTENDNSLIAQIEEGAVSTTIEPYKSNILSANGDKIELTEDMFEQGAIAQYINSQNIGKTYQWMKDKSDPNYDKRRLRLKNLVKVKPNTKLILQNTDNFMYAMCGFDSNKLNLGTFDTSWIQNTTITIPQDVHYISFFIRKKDDTAITINDFKNTKFTLSEVDKTIVLRSLPSGVCDTLNVETGEYIQRIGEVVLNGSEKWEVSGVVSKRYSLEAPINSIINTTKILCICDKFPSITTNQSDYDKLLGITITNGTRIMVNTNYDTIDEFKQYLQQNLATVQYELATPIVTTIDIQGFPHAYTNGHVQLSSGSIEQSLTPKVEYSVVTNRNGQIRSNQKMVERHQKQLDRLQAMILTNLVNTQYEQTLTNLKYDLKNVREEVK